MDVSSTENLPRSGQTFDNCSVQFPGATCAMISEPETGDGANREEIRLNEQQKVLSLFAVKVIEARRKRARSIELADDELSSSSELITRKAKSASLNEWTNPLSKAIREAIAGRGEIEEPLLLANSEVQSAGGGGQVENFHASYSVQDQRATVAQTGGMEAETGNDWKSRLNQRHKAFSPFAAKLLNARKRRSMKQAGERKVYGVLPREKVDLVRLRRENPFENVRDQ